MVVNDGNLWFAENHTENVSLGFRVKEHLFTKQSKHQRIDVFDTYEFGKMLVIDGTVQLTEKDEFIYHEMIAHVPVSILPERPEKVLVIGGGDGGTARELIKHNCRVDLVEIDSDVVEVAKRFFPTVSSALEDSRVDIHIEDGIKFVRDSDVIYDIVIVDSTDPVGVAEPLFNVDFYRNVKRTMKKNGIYVQQSDTPLYHPEVTRKVYSSLKKVFSNVSTYMATIPTYPGAFWAFTLASDEEIKRRRTFDLKLRYYSPHVHDAAFALPPFVENEIHKD